MDETELEREEVIRDYWLLGVREDAAQANPLRDYCRRVYFERTHFRVRSGPKKGTVRKRKTREVELLMFLPSGRCVQINDLKTPGLDALAEEVFSGISLPPQCKSGPVVFGIFSQA
jgi:hypothetical protein